MKHRSLVSCLILLPVAALSARAQSSSAQLPPSSGAQTPVTVSSVCGVGGTYDELTEPWRKVPSSQDIPLGTAPIALTIQTIELSDRAVTEKIDSIPDFCVWNTLSVGVHVSTAGEIFGFGDGEGADRGSSGKLPADIFAQLELLMANLPDDNHRVPPPERRVVVVVEDRGSATVRLYDSGNLPDSVIDMIRLTGVGIKIVTPDLQPDKILRPEEIENADRPALRGMQADLTVSSDKTIGVMHDFTTKTLTVYEGSTWPDAGLPKGGKIVRVIPEFWQPPPYGGYWVNTEFSPDNRYLLVSWGIRIGALLYDTSTWEPVTDPKVFPQKLKEYLHSPDWDLGIAVTESGETLVWDQRAHRVLSKLPGLGELEPAEIGWDQKGQLTYTTPNAEIQFASFSPDRTRVAIYSGPNDTSRLRVSVWELEGSRKLRDFWPMASILSPSGTPLWWNNGRWLVASSGGGKAVWDVATGRFQGSLDLTGCDAREPLVVLGERLQQWCFARKGQEGKVLEWSVDGVQRGLEAFANQISSGGILPR